jgi:hypothetical protein
MCIANLRELKLFSYRDFLRPGLHLRILKDNIISYINDDYLSK